MSLFNNTNLTRITTEYAPSGRIFGKRRDTDSNLWKYFDGTSKEQSRIIDTLNNIFNGLFPRNSVELLELHEKDLGIPDNIFSGQGSISDRQRDVIVKKYMMRGNRTPDYQAIADIYGVTINITTGLKSSIFPLRFPIIFATDPLAELHSLYITFIEDSEYIFPLSFPIQFSAESNTDKVKKIYNHIKPATTKLYFI